MTRSYDASRRGKNEAASVKMVEVFSFAPYGQMIGVPPLTHT